MTLTAEYIPRPPYPLEWALAAVFVLLCCAAEAQAECRAENSGEVTCPKERWVVLRDKARGYEVLCGELDPSELPSCLAEVCEDPGATSRVWVQAERYRKAQETADELQRKLNVKEGRVVELEGRVGRLEEELGAKSQEVGRLRGEVRLWRVVGLSAGGLAALSTVVWVGDVQGWWNL